MTEQVNIDDFKKAKKKLERKQKWEKRINDVKAWASQNPEKAAFAFTTIVGTGAAVVKGGIRITNSLIRTGNVRRENKAKELKIYDRSMMKHWKLRRPLTAEEQIRIANKGKDERLVDLLIDMKVLKL